MKVAIVYYSQHHGNTKKLLDAIKGSGDARVRAVDLINTAKCEKADISGYDLIGFASGIYFGKFSEAVITFAKENLPRGKRVFLIYTYGIKRDYTKGMKKIIAGKSCQLLGTYGCRGFDTFGPLKLIGGIAKGHPDENDLKGAVEFFRGVIQT